MLARNRGRLLMSRGTRRLLGDDAFRSRSAVTPDLRRGVTRFANSTAETTTTTTLDSTLSPAYRSKHRVIDAAPGPRRQFSSNILGYSPMAPTGSGQASSSANHIPTAEEVAMAGGVWAPTSAKRDKLAELRGGLLDGQESLDDAATREQLLDLYLADGIKLIAKVTDAGLDVERRHDGTVVGTDASVIIEFVGWLNNQLVPSGGASPDSLSVNQTQLEANLQIINAKVTNLLENLPPSNRSLKRVRDFLDPDSLSDDELHAAADSNGGKGSNDLDMDQAAFHEATVRFRLLLVKAAVDQLEKSWKVLTTVSDADIDRAAVGGVAMAPQVDTVSLHDVCAFLGSHATGSCSDRVTAAWNLLDRDGDGLLDEDEMNQVAYLCLEAERSALAALFQGALDAYPIRAPPPDVDGGACPPGYTDGPGDDDVPVPKGWRQRRTEASAKKHLSRMFEKSCKNHFTDEVEINHRLRCIYAWADKAHQGNKVESVMVDADGWSGRKRFVELSPKISEAEFREVQRLHFTHLDRLGGEIVKSFREDLWVTQGKGRERKELVRDSMVFLAVVSLADFVILSL